MATIVIISILTVACAFMIYVLVEFHLETKRPRRAVSRLPKGVLAFRRRFAEPRAHEAGQCRTGAGDTLVAPDEKKGSEPTPTVLPVGVRRLAAKRANRSC